MSDFSSVLIAAQQLPEPDRLRLIDAFWESVPDDSEAPFSDEWTREIERRAQVATEPTDPNSPRSQVPAWERLSSKLHFELVSFCGVGFNPRKMSYRVG